MFIIKYKNYLSYSIFSLDDGKNSFLLNGGWLDKTITVNSSQNLFFQT